MVKKFVQAFTTILVALSIFSQFAFAEGSKFNDGFESGKIQSFWNRQLATSQYSGTISNKYAASGSYSFRSELRIDDKIVASRKRAEINLEPEGPLEEHWYSASVYLPSGDEDYAVDTNSNEILIQWHNLPDANEGWTAVPLAFATNNGHYNIIRYWDDAQITTTAQMRKKGNTSTHDLGSYIEDKGTWVNWKFHVKWGWLSSQEPILEVYKNNEKVLDCNGLPNMTNDQRGVEMKLGIYKNDWTSATTAVKSTLSKRVVYFDDISIDDNNSKQIKAPEQNYALNE